MSRLPFRLLCMLLVGGVAVVPGVQAQEEVPPTLSLSTDRPTYALGEPVALTLVAQNESDRLRNYGPLAPGAGAFAWTVTGPEGGVRRPFDLHTEGGVPWISDPFEAVPVGGASALTVPLNYYADLSAPGTYTASVGYPTVSRVPVPTDTPGTYRLQVDGFVGASVTFEVEPGVGAPLADAIRRHLVRSEDPTGVAALYESVAEDAAGTPRGETASFFQLLYHAQVGQTERLDDAAWQQETLLLAEAFAAQYGMSPYRDAAARLARDARYRLDPDAVVNRVGVKSECGGDVYRVVNAGGVPVTLVLQEDAAPAAEVVLDAYEEALVRYGGGERGVVVSVASVPVATVYPDASTCPEAVGTVLGEVDPLNSLPAALVAQGVVEASFSGSAFAVSGVAVRLDGSPDPDAAAVAGVAVATEPSRAEVLGALQSNQATSVTGSGAAPDVVVATAPADLAAWADGLAAAPDLVLGDRPDGPVGTAEAPVVAYAPDGVRLSGAFRGVGVLVVDGGFEMRGDAVWHGVVIVRGTAQATASQLSGTPTVLGALVVLPGPDGASEVSLGGRVTVRYSPEALALARAARQP